ncbi:hypothetical protein GGR53DRAFT_528823 [Hypoxylon sp. FL1150]|nr:hypothetical protein GGR53DRAFT_528823 [Hypoxylon sp. FL1150]
MSPRVLSIIRAAFAPEGHKNGTAVTEGPAAATPSGTPAPAPDSANDTFWIVIYILIFVAIVAFAATHHLRLQDVGVTGWSHRKTIVVEENLGVIGWWIRTSYVPQTLGRISWWIRRASFLKYVGGIGRSIRHASGLQIEMIRFVSWLVGKYTRWGVGIGGGKGGPGDEHDLCWCLL